MKKLILFCFTISALMSCTQVNSTGEKIITQGGDTVSSVEISTSKIDALISLSEIDEPQTNVLKFKASGIEPGWFAEVYENKLRLIVDYGKDSLVMESKFEDLDNKNGFVFDKNGDKSPSNNVKVYIQNKSCTDAGSGEKKDRIVSIIYKSKIYKGCGSFVK
jgi:uncharacterized membrane protein